MSSTAISKPGTMIRARGREWVVLPESTEELLIARPVGGLDEEVAGILTAVEPVKSTTFPPPTEADIGDFSSGFLLREAARLSTRAAAGPFRSFGRIAVEPRPYQFVPLMMALKLDPVRLLIADDVGIGKTIEASLIARELLDRGEIRRLAVLCPPHLAEQWQRELSEKFHIDAELVLSSTIKRLERDLPIDTSVFDQNRFTVVSTDFIKSTRRAYDFLTKCPEFVIVDEAHGCTLAGGVGRSRQQRFELLRKVASVKSRHLLLVTATPHSGNEDAFRSLLSLLDPEFADLPSDLDQKGRDVARRRLARHFVQRRRADIRGYLDMHTPFPERKDKEATYAFSADYRALFVDILNFAKEYVADEEGGKRHRRVRYWSALALLRCVSSSPSAAAATLRSRAAVDLVADDEVDDTGRRSVLDQGTDDIDVTIDISPGSGTANSSKLVRSKLLSFASRAEKLSAGADYKLQGAIREIKALLKNNFRPVVFCRFVDTAKYVASEVRKALPGETRVEAVTGLLPPAEREARIEALAANAGNSVLVCTDCLAEGINLQEQFNAVLHYDLAWNPTRHEQREGRVDRFGQKKTEVRVITYYGTDNPIDGVILDVLIKKHKSIKSTLGVTVAVPSSSEQIVETLLEGALFREQTGEGAKQLTLAFIDEQQKQDMHKEWENARDQVKTSRSRFAQHTLKPAAVAAELENVRHAIGRSTDVAGFFKAVLQAAKVPVILNANKVKVHINQQVPRALRQAIGMDDTFAGSFNLPLEEKEIYLERTSPVIEGLASWTLDQALDPAARDSQPVASRCGVVSTSAVTSRSILFVVRFRYHLQLGGASEHTILCEEIAPLACTGSPEEPVWLTFEESESLLKVRPEKNLEPTRINQQINLSLSRLPKYKSALEVVAIERSATLLATHERVRESNKMKGRMSIKPVLPADILGVYTLLPVIN